ncbi:DNA-binding transcriptional regulator, Lrp family [Amycolatopsis arida]|uniref:DNA-binding transcriptional regulator, Lrp family n=1 Tax=Amycolatopsis arida TaxID=587909 RepID=A0A1I5Z5W0_9PSEU|nr:Lrp/AsnC family transcriptional regulator [Amycolatopsis arida]TDX90166.1 DNA-binding Lrp family transcriptional regulator [Amycolatopsis arida]SFQ51831.1 DNA-binding transcriptional regulator, Lrp family [Amycolatopsis arida]
MLDAVDADIVAALQKDARLPNKDLAALVNVAPSTCLVRHRALRERGVITGYRAEVDLGQLGRPLQAVIAVRVRPHTRAVVRPFMAAVLRLPETISVSHVAGPEDFLVHVAVADAAHLQRLVLDAFTSRPEVAQLHTNLLFEHVRKEEVPPTPDVLA